LMRVFTRVFACAVILFASRSALSELTSEEFALMASTAWAAFECSTLVDKSDRPDERQDLFDYGYEQGSLFIQALLDGKIDNEHLYRHVPLSVLDRLEPFVHPRLPTPEFALGAIWESASSSVLEQMRESGSSPAQFAMNEFSRRNCRAVLVAAREHRRQR
jgi:hypothetical protein